MKRRDSEPDALRLWCARQRRAFWRKWRGVIIALGAAFLVSMLYEAYSYLSWLHIEYNVRAGLPIHPLANWEASNYQWAESLIALMHALVFSLALVLQLVLLKSLLLPDELKIAFANRMVSSFYIMKSIAQPVAVFGAVICTAFIISNSIDLYYWNELRKIFSEFSSQDISFPIMQSIRENFFSLQAYCLLDEAICTTIAHVWVSINLIRHQRLRLAAMLPALAYTTYWVVLHAVHMDPLEEFYLWEWIPIPFFLPLSAILLIIVIITAYRYYRDNIRQQAV